MNPKYKIGQEVGITGYSGTFTIQSISREHVWMECNPRPFPISDLFEIDNTPQFKVGDKVRCINRNIEGLNGNDHYTITHTSPTEGLIWIKGANQIFISDDFELVKEETPMFKKDDKVKCIDAFDGYASNDLTLNKTYTILDTCDGLVKILNCNDQQGWYQDSRFELVKEDTKPKLNTLEEQLELIKAEAEGKLIEIFTNGKWGIKCGVGYWSFPLYTYRIEPVKPKKVKKTVTKYVIINSIGSILSIHNTKDEALKRSCPTAKVVTLKGSYYTTEEQ